MKPGGGRLLVWLLSIMKLFFVVIYCLKFGINSTGSHCLVFQKKNLVLIGIRYGGMNPCLSIYIHIYYKGGQRERENKKERQRFHVWFRLMHVCSICHRKNNCFWNCQPTHIEFKNAIYLVRTWTFLKRVHFASN